MMRKRAIPLAVLSAFGMSFGLLGCIEREPETGSLASQLTGIREEQQRNASPEELRVYEESIASVRAAGITDRAKKAGDKASDFRLLNALRDPVRLSDLLAAGPVVLVWYRGGWCPYCNATLKAMQRVMPQIRRLGATLVAISPDLPDSSLTTAQKLQLEYEVLTDYDNRVARSYGLVYKLSPQLAERLELRANLPRRTGVDADELPLAATYVIRPDGVIHYAFLDADYRRRAEPADVVRALKELRGGKGRTAGKPVVGGS